MSLPLEGVRVLDMAHMMQGPWAAEILADLGADVVKLEAPSGERGRQSGTIFVGQHSAQYIAMNRNKRSAVVDLKTAEGRAAALRLAQRADVLIQNFRPGTLEKFGLGWEQLKEVNPKLIYCQATGYGPHVPDPSTPGQDLLAQARTGMLWLSGKDDGMPVVVGPFVADSHAASMIAVAVNAALFRRQRTGLGGFVEMDLIGAALHLQVQEVSSYLNGGVPPRQHSKPSTPYIEAPYGCYKAQDSRWIAISLSETGALGEALGLPDLAARFPDKHSADVHRDEFYAALDDAIARRPAHEWLERLGRAGIWCAPVNDYDSMQNDDMVAWTHRSHTVDVPGAGEVTVVANPIRLDGESLPLRMPPPALGEHTQDVLDPSFWSDDNG